MKWNHSYTITINNNQTEKEAIDFLLTQDAKFIRPDKESRKLIMNNLGIDKKYSRAFDLIMIPERINDSLTIEIDTSSIILVELKTTKKKLLNNPYGFFFWATENEFALARLMGDKFRFCLVSLHLESLSFKLLTLEELEELVSVKRTQFQINLRNKAL